MNNRFVWFVTAAFIMLSACNKQDTTHYHGKIKNALSARVNLNFYKTKEDYNNSTNPVLTTTIAPQESFDIPADWTGGDTYYLDWYTDDYLYSNWGGNSPLFNVPNITPEMDPALTIYAEVNNARKVCLKNNEQQSTWKAIDAFYGSSVWSTLNDNEKYRMVVLKKDLTGTYSYKNAAGDIIQLPFTYFASSSSVYYPVNIYVSFSPGTGNVYVLMNPYNPSGSGVAFDTLNAQSNFPPGGSYNYYYFKQ